MAKAFFGHTSHMDYRSAVHSAHCRVTEPVQALKKSARKPGSAPDPLRA